MPTVVPIVFSLTQSKPVELAPCLTDAFCNLRKCNDTLGFITRGNFGIKLFDPEGKSCAQKNVMKADKNDPRDIHNNPLIEKAVAHLALYKHSYEGKYWHIAFNAFKTALFQRDTPWARELNEKYLHNGRYVEGRSLSFFWVGSTTHPRDALALPRWHDVRADSGAFFEPYMNTLLPTLAHIPDPRNTYLFPILSHEYTDAASAHLKLNILEDAHRQTEIIFTRLQDGFAPHDTKVHAPIALGKIHEK